MPTISSAPSTHFSLAQHFLIATPNMDDPRFQRSVIYIWEHTQDGAAGLCINQRGPTSLAGLMRQVNLPLTRADLQHVDVGWGGPLHPEQGFVLHTTTPYLADAPVSAQTPDSAHAAAMPSVRPLLAASSAVTSRAQRGKSTSYSAVTVTAPASAPVSVPAHAASTSTRTATEPSPSGFQYQSTLYLPDGLQLTTSRDLLANLYANTGPRHLLPVLGYAAWDAGQLEDELRTSCWLITAAHPDIIFHTPVHQRYARACALLGIHNIALLAPGGRG